MPFLFSLSLSYGNFTAIAAVAVLLKLSIQPFPVSETDSDERLRARLWPKVSTQLVPGHCKDPSHRNATIPPEDSLWPRRLHIPESWQGHTSQGRPCFLPFLPVAIQHCCPGARSERRARGAESGGTDTRAHELTSSVVNCSRSFDLFLLFSVKKTPTNQCYYFRLLLLALGLTREVPS